MMVLVQFGVLAFHLQARLLAARHGQIAHDAGELAPNVADRLHAGFHHAGLQFGRQQIESLHRCGKSRFVLRTAQLHHLVAGQDQFADKRHQLVQQPDIDPNRAVRDDRGTRLACLGDDGRRRHKGCCNLGHGRRRHRRRRTNC